MQKTPLYENHLKAQAKMVEFAGYSMPIQYSEGIAKEHLWVRNHTGMFDVSHMGQLIIEGQDAAAFFEKITPSAFSQTPHGKAKYTVLTNQEGGIIDDLIITRLTDDKFFVVINAACKEKDIAWMESHLPVSLALTRLDDRALIAIQGGEAESILGTLLPEADLASQGYMSIQATSFAGTDIFISRLGYTGEDGFEISISANKAPEFWDALTEKGVKPIGLGARDSLRLEMGYPLYGHDLDETTSPIEADLGWVVRKKDNAFIGGERVAKERESGISRKRVGVKLTGRGIAREGSPIFLGDKKIGTLTSGSPSPLLKQSIGQGYVDISAAKHGTIVEVEVRGNKIKAEVTSPMFLKPKTKTA